MTWTFEIAAYFDRQRQTVLAVHAMHIYPVYFMRCWRYTPHSAELEALCLVGKSF